MNQSKLPGSAAGPALLCLLPPPGQYQGPAGVSGLALTPLSSPHPSSLLFKTQNRALGPSVRCLHCCPS